MHICSEAAHSPAESRAGTYRLPRCGIQPGGDLEGCVVGRFAALALALTLFGCSPPAEGYSTAGATDQGARIDDLEVRIGALEKDHQALEQRLTEDEANIQHAKQQAAETYSEN